MPILMTNADGQEEELKYDPTDKDEEKFLLMYLMHMQPSEIESMSDDYRKWVLARFAAQKQMEREMYMQQKLAQNLDISKLKI